MKSFPSRRGFTLIELLTVIAIIVVLMGLLFPAIGSVKETMRKTQAKNDVTQIVTAVKAYYTEYGKYPVKSGATGKYDSSNSEVLDVLRGLTSTGSDENLNPRKIVFLEVNDAKDPKNPKSGIKTSTPGASGDWVDPWGEAYKIRVDADYDNEVEDPVNTSSKIRTGAVAWSVAKNKSNADWVCSWK